MILYTKIKTIRNELVTIPNQTLLQREIINYSGMDVLAISVEIALTYDNNWTAMEKLLVDSAAGTDGIIKSRRLLSCSRGLTSMPRSMS